MYGVTTQGTHPLEIWPFDPKDPFIEQHVIPPMQLISWRGRSMSTLLKLHSWGLIDSYIYIVTLADFIFF